MNSQEQSLWQSIKEFNIDGGLVSFPFHRRLARENGWSPPFAVRVIREYQKFVFLACVAGHPVTPSDQVDQAWHLHLTYVDSYWNRMTPLLPRPLVHGPTKGGKAEDSKFEDWYARTLASYRAWFGEEPPSDIWPPSGVRFEEPRHFQRVNTRTHWVIAKPSFRPAQVALTATLALGLAGCSVATVGFRDQAWIGIGCVVLVVALIAYLHFRGHGGAPAKKATRKDRNDCGSGGFAPMSGCGSSDSRHGDADGPGGNDAGCGNSSDGGSSGCSGGGCGGGCGS
jgi:hypothetical protein